MVSCIDLGIHRSDSDCCLVFNVYPLPLATTTLKATPPVEDLSRVLQCGGLECIDKRRCEAIVTDDAKLYPRIGDSWVCRTSMSIIPVSERA